MTAPVDIELLDGRLRLRKEYLLRWRVVVEQPSGRVMVIPHDTLRLELGFLRGWLRFLSIAWETSLPPEGATGPGSFTLELSAALDERARWEVFSTMPVPASYSSATPPSATPPSATPQSTQPSSGARPFRRLQLGLRRRF